MSAEIRIIHITDIHITENRELLRDIDVRKNFKAVIHEIHQLPADLVIFGGDLAANCGELESYKWIKQALKQLAFPFFITAGNHDVIDHMDSIFQLGNRVKEGELFYREEINNHTLFFLDSSSAKISDKQLNWLQEEMKTVNGEALLFVHHPPCLCGCTFMDRKYPLKNRDRVFARLKKIKRIKSIFCGHYHTEKTIIKADKNIFITPSTMVQLHTDRVEYKVNSYQAGWRMIEWDGIQLNTSVSYL